MSAERPCRRAATAGLHALRSSLATPEALATALPGASSTPASSERLHEPLHCVHAGMENAQFSRVRCRAVPPPAGADPGSAPPARRHVLTCLLNNRNGAHLSLWELGPDGLLTMCGAGRVAESPGTCLDVSADGALAVMGTSEGDVVVSLGCHGPGVALAGGARGRECAGSGASGRATSAVDGGHASSCKGLLNWRAAVPCLATS